MYPGYAMGKNEAQNMRLRRYGMYINFQIDKRNYQKHNIERWSLVMSAMRKRT